MVSPDATAIDEIRGILAQFQAGYTRRDPQALDAFMQLFSDEPGLEVIGTGAIRPSDQEWCLGREAVRTLVRSDWEGWGDLVLDVEGARIFTRGEVGWLATSGTVTISMTAEETYRDYLDYVKKLLDRQGEPDWRDERKVYEIVYSGSHTMMEMQRGKRFVWPFRFTALLLREADGWRFHQMQFSFPTTRYPDERSF